MYKCKKRKKKGSSIKKDQKYPGKANETRMS